MSPYSGAIGALGGTGLVQHHRRAAADGRQPSREAQLRLAPGERLTFGRSADANDLPIGHEGVSRAAGEITAHGAFWILSNLSAHQTYVVENPEGAGEHAAPRLPA